MHTRYYGKSHRGSFSDTQRCSERYIKCWQILSQIENAVGQAENEANWAMWEGKNVPPLCVVVSVVSSRVLASFSQKVLQEIFQVINFICTHTIFLYFIDRRNKLYQETTNKIYISIVYTLC